MDHLVEIKKGADYPPIRYILKSDQSGQAIDLASATVTFRMMDSNGSNLIDAAHLKH